RGAGVWPRWRTKPETGSAPAANPSATPHAQIVLPRQGRKAGREPRMTRITRIREEKTLRPTPHAPLSCVCLSYPCYPCHPWLILFLAGVIRDRQLRLRSHLGRTARPRRGGRPAPGNARRGEGNRREADPPGRGDG